MKALRFLSGTRFPVVDRAACAAVTLLLVNAPHVATAGETPQRYVMSIYLDAPASELLLAGRYAEAIGKLESRRGESLEKSTALCVAYTGVGDFDQAEEACGASLGAARHVMRGLGLEGLRARNEARAQAYANRGVMFAVSGRAERAAADFERAVSLDEDRTAYDRNLALAESRVPVASLGLGRR